MKIGVISIIFLVLVVAVFSGGFFLYTGNVVNNKLYAPNLIMDDLYVYDNNVVISFCNNAQAKITNKVYIDLSIEGEQLKPVYTKNGIKTITRQYNLENFGRKCIQDKVSLNKVIGDSEFIKSVVKARIYTKNNMIQMWNYGKTAEIGKYHFANGILVKN